jgi:hypothetical protein
MLAAMSGRARAQGDAAASGRPGAGVPRPARPWGGLAITALLGRWSYGLGAGLQVAVAGRELGLLRVGLFVVAATALLAAGLRTLYELVRRLRA